MCASSSSRISVLVFLTLFAGSSVAARADGDLDNAPAFSGRVEAVQVEGMRPQTIRESVLRQLAR